MKKNVVFRNYISQCPKCGGDLNSDHIFCPYCGLDLKIANKKHKDDEKIIVETINDLDTTNSDIKNRSLLNSQHKQKKEINNAIRVLEYVFIAYFFMMVIWIIPFWFDSIIHKRVVNKIVNQDVAMSVAELVEYECDEFTSTNLYQYTNPSDHVMESDDMLAIPMYDIVSPSYIFIDKNGEDVGIRIEESYGPDYSRPVIVTYKNCEMRFYSSDGYSETRLDLYDNIFDLISFETKDIKNAIRFNDMQLGDLIFEQYLIDETYYIYATCEYGDFIVCEIYGYDSTSFDLEDAFVVRNYADYCRWRKNGSS